MGSRGRAEAAIAGHTGDQVTARRLMGDPDSAVRATALAALARMGTLTDADLASAVVDPAAVVRRRAAALAVAHPATSLLTLLADADAAVAEQAAWALGERTPPEDGAVAALVDVARTHADALVREAAVAALGALGDVAGLPAVLSATTDKPAIRRRAVLALAPFEGPEVDAALARALDDRDWQVRQAAELLTAPDPD